MGDRQDGGGSGRGSVNSDNSEGGEIDSGVARKGVGGGGGGGVKVGQQVTELDAGEQSK